MTQVNVLIVDDSAFFRRRLTEIIQLDPRLTVIGTASNGQEAVKMVSQLKPDVITMDIEMPQLDGISAVRQIMRRRPTPILMLSTWTTDGAKATIEALEAGAMDYLPKRFEDLAAELLPSHRLLCDRLDFLAKHHRSKPTGVTSEAATLAPKSATSATRTQPLKLVVIGTSTGGPVALQKLLSQLPGNIPYPIVLLQHMPAAFTPSFAERLNQLCAITVKEAATNDILAPGTAYLAPGGHQLQVTGNINRMVLNVSAGNSHETYKPCIDITLNSIASICPENTLAIILTGMGSDGSQGAKLLHERGAAIWAQDQASSTIYGMPMAVAKAGIADKIMNLTQMAQQLTATH